ncbi:MAG: hypothetical protein Q7T86_16905 [Hyphomicrobiaceae bacterium]|jgi:hypothetical protein|nr:hypothetical protein [Hyphomicrobiaceae bacterium]
MYENAGLLIWVWILVGNAIGIFILNGAGGDTSAMSTRPGVR